MISTINTTMNSTGYPSSDNNTKLNGPGKNVVVAFVIRHLNSEVACGNSGALAWSSLINYPLLDDVGYVNPAIKGDHYGDWWEARISSCT